MLLYNIILCLRNNYSAFSLAIGMFGYVYKVDQAELTIIIRSAIIFHHCAALLKSHWKFTHLIMIYLTCSNGAMHPLCWIKRFELLGSEENLGTSDFSFSGAMGKTWMLEYKLVMPASLTCFVSQAPCSQPKLIGAAVPGWVGGVPVAGGDLHLYLLRSGVGGTGGWFFDDIGFCFCVSFAKHWKPKLDCAS